MLLIEMFVYSLAEQKMLKNYKFNLVGLNIILGEQKVEGDEANGVGKTTMVECMEFLLGRTPADYYCNNIRLLGQDIFIVLQVNNDGTNEFWGRCFKSPKSGYRLISPELHINLEKWAVLPDKQYKDLVQKAVLGDCSDRVTFAGLREFIIRDEKRGFNDIVLPNRDALKQYMILAYLFYLPYEAETEIYVHRKKIDDLTSKIKLLEAAVGMQINELRIKEKQLKTEIAELDRIIGSFNITEQFEKSARIYSEVKGQLHKVYQQIFELEHVSKQYKQNIKNLQEKTDSIKQLNDIEPFYQQLLEYFPEQIRHDNANIIDFYNFMVDNRGKYFENKISAIAVELERLYVQKQHLEDVMVDNSKILKSHELIDDVSVTLDERKKKFLELAEVTIRIQDYNKKNTLMNDINALRSEKLRLTMVRNDEFSSCAKHIAKLEELFNVLMEKSYNATGILNFEFDNRTDDKKNITTGRVKITCTIPDEKSHGRLYMKINMFDLTWFLNRLGNNLPVNFLIHDGSYCKPDPTVKAKLLKWVDEKMCQWDRGQYFITINKGEIHSEDLTYFDKKGCVVAKLDRSNEDRNRFFGFRFSV